MYDVWETGPRREEVWAELSLASLRTRTLLPRTRTLTMGPSYYLPNSTASSHDLNTLADFADTLDALPLELTRGFSDLRELDAVLSCTFLPACLPQASD